MYRSRWGALGALCVVLLVLTACAPQADSPPQTNQDNWESVTPRAGAGNSSSNPPGNSETGKSTNPASTRAQEILGKLTLEQRVSQVVMGSAPAAGASPQLVATLRDNQIGNVFLQGRSAVGVAQTTTVSASLKDAMREPSGGVNPYIATDQEGGAVQVLSGPGFSAIPAAIAQSQWSPEQIKESSTRWGKELAAAGVNLNLAPVLDTVPSPAFAAQNAPIGLYGRQYGYTPEQVSSLGVAAAKGYQEAGVEPTVKHFPGLGRVTENTDISAGVTDETTTRGDAYLKPFQDAVNAGVNWVMISNALYPAIDANRIAPFSSVIIGEMLRKDLGFTGVVISDDICDAVQLSATPVDQRGVEFLDAGGSMALCTNPNLVGQLRQGILTKAKADSAFAQKIADAALKILEAKDKASMLK